MSTERDLMDRIRHFFFSAVLAMAVASPASASETITYFHNDIAGSPLLATDVNGMVAWKETYRPYGDRVLEDPASTNNALWFTGKPHDDSTGLTYMGARYYDPVLGRFTGPDPVAVDPSDIHSINRYAHAKNNPYKYVDPDGKDPRLFFHQNMSAEQIHLFAKSEAMIASLAPVQRQANYQARQIVGNTIAATSSVASLVPPLTIVAAPISTIASGLTAMDQAFNEDLTGTEVATTAVTMLPLASVARSLNASESVITLITVDTAFLGVTSGAVAVAQGLENGSNLTIQEDQNTRTYDSKENDGQWE